MDALSSFALKIPRHSRRLCLLHVHNRRYSSLIPTVHCIVVEIPFEKGLVVVKLLHPLQETVVFFLTMNALRTHKD